MINLLLNTIPTSSFISSNFLASHQCLLLNLTKIHQFQLICLPLYLKYSVVFYTSFTHFNPITEWFTDRDQRKRIAGPLYLAASMYFRDWTFVLLKRLESVSKESVRMQAKRKFTYDNSKYLSEKHNIITAQINLRKLQFLPVAECEILIFK